MTGVVKRALVMYRAPFRNAAVAGMSKLGLVMVSSRRPRSARRDSFTTDTAFEKFRTTYSRRSRSTSPSPLVTSSPPRSTAFASPSQGSTRYSFPVKPFTISRSSPSGTPSMPLALNCSATNS